MAGKQSSRCPTEQTTLKAADFLQAENDRLIHELRAFVSVALQHGLQDYCETRHPALTAEIRSSQDKSQVGARKKYADALARISKVPGLQGETGHTGDRTYYRNAQDNGFRRKVQSGQERSWLSWVSSRKTGIDLEGATTA